MPFGDIVGKHGGSGPIDLFQFTDRNQHPRAKKGVDPEVLFDPVKYPPTKDGLKKLLKQLKTVAWKNCTKLVPRNHPMELCCFRCRTSVSHKKKKDDGVPDKTKKGKNAPVECDDDGVQLDIREYRLHCDHLQREKDGQSRNKGNNSVLPSSSEFTCKVSLKLDYTADKSHICLKQGFGHSTHTFHSQQDFGDFALQKRHCSKKTQELAKSGAKACVGSGSTRTMILTHHNEFLNRSTLQSLQTPQCLEPGAAPVTGGQSTASQLINWLRKMARDPIVGLHYCFISSVRDGVQHHKHPKGRPPKEGRLPLQVVNQNMAYVDTMHNTYTRRDAKDDEAHERNRNIILQQEGGTEGDPLPVLPVRDVEEHTEELPDTASDLQRRVKDIRQVRKLHMMRMDNRKVLLGAAWVDEDSRRQFLRFPEVLFIDSTHKTNNEGRPLLQVCGRDSRGRAYVVVRIFMPNESGSFYRWVFLNCIPQLLGSRNLSRVRVMITDGDSHEFNAIDEAIFQHFVNATRIRCSYHVVQKTWEKEIFPTRMPQPALAETLMRDLKLWIYKWGDGTSCATEEQCQFSKTFLLHTIQTNKDVLSIIGSGGVTDVLSWLNTKVLVHERKICLWARTHVRGFDEYMNNSGEAMNRSVKGSDVSTNPSMQMKTAADAMLTHTGVKAKERRSDVARQLDETPLHIIPGKAHDVDVLKQLCNLSRHLIIQQFRERKNHSVLEMSPEEWRVTRETGNCVNSSILTPPRIRTAWKVCLRHGILVCDCGYRHRVGIPCRHLFCIEQKYEVSDIASRWQIAYAYWGHNPKMRDLTRLYEEMEAKDHNGLRLKSWQPPIREECPYLWEGSKICKAVFDRMINGARPLCWNYNKSSYPPMADSTENGYESEGHGFMFSQESYVEMDDETLEGVGDHSLGSHRAPDLNHGQMMTSFKDALRLCTSKEDRQTLNALIVNFIQQKNAEYLGKRKAEECNEEDEYFSSQVPFDRSKKSTQHTYKRNRR